MKTTVLLPITALVAIASVHAQGPLTPPPGAPAPVMKSLDQIEARTPLVAGQPGVTVSPTGTITISQPGSYYLTGNLTLSAFGVNGISIGTTSAVTLDLNGYTIRHTGANSGFAAGIFISGTAAQTVVIRNGHIHGPGFERGVNFNNTLGGTLLVENLHLNGMVIGLLLQRDEGRTVVENCTVSDMSGMGISADVVKNCTVRNAGGSNPGISASLVSNCHVEQASGTAHAISGRVVENSVGISAGGIGIAAEIATQCYGGSSTGTFGMNISGTASFCRAYRSGGTALSAGIAIGCTSLNGAISSTQKHLGTP